MPTGSGLSGPGGLPLCPTDDSGSGRSHLPIPPNRLTFGGDIIKTGSGSHRLAHTGALLPNSA
nr:hypothetical protein OG999_11720 [Streptomyces sp. NBC_00886]